MIDYDNFFMDEYMKEMWNTTLGWSFLGKERYYDDHFFILFLVILVIHVKRVYGIVVYWFTKQWGFGGVLSLNVHVFWVEVLWFSFAYFGRLKGKKESSCEGLSETLNW